MTKLEKDETGFSDAAKKVLISLIGGLLMVFIAGIIAGFTAASLEHGELVLRDFGIIAALISFLAFVGFVCWRLWPHGSQEVIAESTRKSNRLLYFACVLGVALGMFLVLAEEGSAGALFSNAPLGGLVAAVGIAVWLLIVPPMTWIWWRTVDEHEASAYTDGALVAGHVYMILAPAWWFASRAGWLPAQDPMIVFVIIATIWTAIWLYRRFF